jgi:hypothetical protein
VRARWSSGADERTLAGCRARALRARGQGAGRRSGGRAAQGGGRRRGRGERSPRATSRHEPVDCSRQARPHAKCCEPESSVDLWWRRPGTCVQSSEFKPGPCGKCANAGPPAGRHRSCSAPADNLVVLQLMRTNLTLTLSDLFGWSPGFLRV